MSMSLTRLDAQGYPDEAGLIARAIENEEIYKIDNEDRLVALG